MASDKPDVIMLSTQTDVATFLVWLRTNHPDVYAQYTIVSAAKSRVMGIEPKYVWGASQRCPKCGSGVVKQNHMLDQQAVVITCGDCDYVLAQVNEWEVLDGRMKRL